MSGWAAAAAGLAATAVLVASTAGKVMVGADQLRAGRTGGLRWLGWATGLVVAVLITWRLDPGVAPQAPALAVGAVPVAIVVRHLVRCQRRRSLARRRAQQVLDVCDALAAELHAGIRLSSAIERACRPWPDLAAVAVTSQLGGDVVAALHRAGDPPGAGGMRAVAAAVEVADRSGASLARVLDRTGESLRHELDARAEVTAALGPPRATARMLMVLPLFGLALGASLGAHPVGFLLGTVFGTGCLIGGLLLSLLGLVWVERIADGAEG